MTWQPTNEVRPAIHGADSVPRDVPQQALSQFDKTIWDQAQGGKITTPEAAFELGGKYLPDGLDAKTWGEVHEGLRPDFTEGRALGFDPNGSIVSSRTEVANGSMIQGGIDSHVYLENSSDLPGFVLIYQKVKGQDVVVLIGADRLQKDNPNSALQAVATICTVAKVGGKPVLVPLSKTLFNEAFADITRGDRTTAKSRPVELQTPHGKLPYSLTLKNFDVPNKSVAGGPKQVSIHFKGIQPGVPITDAQLVAFGKMS